MARTPARKAAPLDLDALRGDRSRDPSWCWLLAGPRRGQSLPGRTLSRMQPGPPSVPGRHPPSGRCLAVSSAASKRSAGLAKVVGGGRYIRRGTSARSRSQSCQYAHRRGDRGSGSCARSDDSCRHRPAQWSLGEAVLGCTTAVKYVLDYLPESNKKPAQAHRVPRMAAGGGGHRRAAVGRSFSNLRLAVEALPVKISGRAENEDEDRDFARNALPIVAAALADQLPVSRHTGEKDPVGISERAERHRERAPPPASEKGQRRARSGPPKEQSLEERPLTGSLQVPGFSYEINISAGAIRATSWHARSAADPRLPCAAAAQSAMPPSVRARPARPGTSGTSSGPRDCG